MRCKSGRERTDWLLSLEARALLAAVSLTTASQRNLFHSKRCLNGTANSATTCLWQAASARQRRIQQGPDARSSSQSVPPSNMEGEIRMGIERQWRCGPGKRRVYCAGGWAWKREVYQHSAYASVAQWIEHQPTDL